MTNTLLNYLKDAIQNDINIDADDKVYVYDISEHLTGDEIDAAEKPMWQHQIGTTYDVMKIMQLKASLYNVDILDHLNAIDEDTEGGYYYDMRKLDGEHLPKPLTYGEMVAQLQD